MSYVQLTHSGRRCLWFIDRRLPGSKALEWFQDPRGSEVPSTSELEQLFHEQIALLADENVDAIQLETFTHVDEAELAARIAASYNLPVFVSVTVGKDGETRRGERIEQIIRQLDACDAVDAIGINCGLGPAAAFSIAERACRK